MALTSLGVALWEVRRFDEAITAHQDAAAIYRETGDEYRENIALNKLKDDQAGRAVGVSPFPDATPSLSPTHSLLGNRSRN